MKQLHPSQTQYIYLASNQPLVLCPVEFLCCLQCIRVAVQLLECSVVLKRVQLLCVGKCRAVGTWTSISAACSLKLNVWTGTGLNSRLSIDQNVIKLPCVTWSNLDCFLGFFCPICGLRIEPPAPPIRSHKEWLLAGFKCTELDLK